eukprot:1818190-Pyramimonas_sp.AAC.1
MRRDTSPPPAYFGSSEPTPAYARLTQHRWVGHLGGRLPRPYPFKNLLLPCRRARSFEQSGNNCLVGGHYNVSEWGVRLMLT